MLVNFSAIFVKGLGKYCKVAFEEQIYTNRILDIIRSKLITLKKIKCSDEDMIFGSFLPVMSESLVLSITTVADMTPLSLISDKIVEYPDVDGMLVHSFDTVEITLIALSGFSQI